jgi:hypothetical protein
MQAVEIISDAFVCYEGRWRRPSRLLDPLSGEDEGTPSNYDLIAMKILTTKLIPSSKSSAEQPFVGQNAKP